MEKAIVKKVVRIEPEGQWASWMAEHEDNHSTWCSKGPFSSGAKIEGPKHVKEPCKSRKHQPPSLIASSASSLASRSLYPLASFLQISFLRVCSFPTFFYLTLDWTCQTGFSCSPSMSWPYPRLDLNFSHKLCYVTMGKRLLSRRERNCHFLL